MGDEKKAANQERALVKNAADEEQVRDAGQAEKLRDIQQSQDLVRILALPEGRRILWRVLSQSHCFRQSTPNGLDGENLSEKTFFNEGKRSIGNWLWTEIQAADPDSLFTMMREGASEP